MTVTIKVKPGSRKEGIALENDVIVVRVNAQPVDGKANEAVIRLLSETLDVPKSQISIAGGAASRMKRVDMSEPAGTKLLAMLNAGSPPTRRGGRKGR